MKMHSWWRDDATKFMILQGRKRNAFGVCKSSRVHLPGPCCVVLAMIHFTRQHFIKDLRESRGLCHLEPSVCSPEFGSFPLASGTMPPSTAFSSSWVKSEMHTNTRQHYTGGRLLATGSVFMEPEFLSCNCPKMRFDKTTSCVDSRSRHFVPPQVFKRFFCALTRCWCLQTVTSLLHLERDRASRGLNAEYKGINNRPDLGT